MYVLFLAVGFAGGVLASQVVLARRLEQRAAAVPAHAAPVAEMPQIAVNVNVSEELVARYLASYNLVAIPRDALKGLEEQLPTRH